MMSTAEVSGGDDGHDARRGPAPGGVRQPEACRGQSSSNGVQVQVLFKFSSPDLAAHSESRVPMTGPCPGLYQSLFLRVLR
jgi:hypothetical protein